MIKKVAVLWSGGLDSTYLIYKNLEEGNEVYPYYVEIGNNSHKAKKELEAIDKISKILRSCYPKFNSHKILLKLDVFSPYDYFISKQMPIWIFALQWIAGVDEIQLGYVMNDDAISYIEDIKNAYYAFDALKEKTVPIVFPLTKMNKYQEYDNLPEKYSKLIWYCENPTNDGSPCGGCHSCRRYKELGIGTKEEPIPTPTKYYESLGDDIIKETYEIEMELPTIMMPDSIMNDEGDVVDDCSY